MAECGDFASKRRMAKDTSAWDIIANYESHDIVRARYQAKHAWEPNAGHAREIAAPFTQARHYYSSAAGADRSVKPLLLYYGVLSLSRGLVLFLTRTLREAALAQSHGLSVADWQSVLSLPNPDVADLKIVVNGSGSFVELLRATGNRNLVRGGSSAINHKTSEGPVATGTALTLGELLARLPDVVDQLRRWKTPQCVPFSVTKIEGTPNSTITVPRWPGPHVSDQLVVDIVGPEHCELTSSDDKFVIVRTKNAGTSSGMVTDLVDLAGIGDLYLARRYPSGVRLGKIGQLFAIAYVLGMVVRYYPTVWMDVTHQRIGDAANPTIFRVIDILETLYPRIVVDFLEE
jgi:hypothetical protein